ncbi:MAG: sigma-70 family RNA polymerase sigma factor [Acidobacteria bacterium]|nr:sigma-70 family RNA polymerase sigma factor [Acidobacteriota bacterium]
MPGSRAKARAGVNMYRIELEAPRVGSKWAAIVAQIRRGDADAEIAFDELCRPGIRLLLQLNVSSVGLERLAEETVAGAVDAVRRGWIREPKHLATFVRSVIERHTPAAACLGASAQARVRQRALEIEQALAAFTPAEQECLRRFYSDGWDVARIVSETGVPAEEFSRLRQRLRAASGVSPAWSPLAKGRAAAAGA